MKKWDLTGKKALVTGGSKGIGKAVVRELSQLGAEVLFTGRDRSDLQLALDDLDDTMHLTHFLQGDISVSEHRAEVNDWISRRWGKLDILVNNAGINMRKPTNDYSVEEYMTVIGTDLLAPFELSRLLYPLLKKSQGASVINIASVAGKFDVRTGAPYGMAKAGLIQLTRCLAAEWAPDGIRTNSVSPWFTETPRRVNVWHISLYIGLLDIWRLSNFSNQFKISRKLLMEKSHFKSITTYHKCINQLIELGYIAYLPTYDSYQGSLVEIIL